jgi:O-phosphoseryl-tRNA(Cys) synthetase
MVNNPILQVITQKQFTAKTSYWLARVFDKLQREAKIYLAEKQKLIEKYARRYEADGEQKDNTGKVIKSWKKGDIVGDEKSVSLSDAEGFTKEINELTEIELDIGINKIEFDFDKEPACTVEEMSLLLPIIKEVE